MQIGAERPFQVSDEYTPAWPEPPGDELPRGGLPTATAPMPRTPSTRRTAGGPSGLPTGTNYFPSGSQTMGNPMYPWLMPYEGDFAAPMSYPELAGMSGVYDYVGGGMGLGGAEDYLSDVIGGDYLDPSTNRWLAGIQSGAQALKDIQDTQARRRIGSSMAAGGHALSGARMGAEQDYQNLSDARFQEMISRLMSDQYQHERGLQQGAIPMRMGLSDQRLGGYERLMGAGRVPREIEEGNLRGEYGDWLRQIQGQEEAFRYPDLLSLNTLGRGFAGSRDPRFAESEASGWMALLGPLLDRLLGGGSGGKKPAGGGGGPSIGGGPSGGGRPGGGGGAGGAGAGAGGGAMVDPGWDWGDWDEYWSEEPGAFGSSWDEIFGGGGGGEGILGGSTWDDIFGSDGTGGGGGDLWGSDWSDIFSDPSVDYGYDSGGFSLFD